MASEDRILKILIQIQSDLAGLGPLKGGVDDLKKKTEDAAKAGFSLGDAFKFAGAEEGLRRTLDFIKEIPVTIEESIKKGVEFQAEMQRVQTSIAGIFRQNAAQTFIDWDAAKGAAGDTIDLLKNKAGEVGIAYADMFEAYTHSVNAMFAGGINNIKEQIDLIALLNRSLQSIGLSSTTAARDITDLLSGFASRTIGGRQLAAGMGFGNVEEMDKAVLAANQAGKAFQFWTEHLAGFQQAIADGSKNFSSDIERMKNAVLELEGDAARPIMQPLQEAIRTFSEMVSSGEFKAAAQEIGEFVADVIRGFTDLSKAIADSGSQLGQLARIAASLSGVPGLSYLVGKVGGSVGDLEAGNRVVQLTKESQAIIDQVQQAKNLQEAATAQFSLEDKIAEIKRTLPNLTGQDNQQLQTQLRILEQILAHIGDYLGTTVQITQRHVDQTKQLEAIRTVMGDIALKNVEASGDKGAIAEARAEAAAEKTLKTLREKGVVMGEAVRLALQEYDATLKLIGAKDQEKDAHKEITEFLREESRLVQQIHNAQQVITANPFLSADQKEALQVPLIISEINQLNAKITEGQALMHGGTLDPEKYAEVGKAVDGLRTKVQLLGFQLQTSSFGGAFTADLTKWANSFGTAAQQAASALTSTLNTAIGSTSQALTGLIFQTGNWKQTFAQAIESIVSGMIRMALQFAVSRLLMTVINRVAGTADASAATGQAAGAAAAWSPAAVSASIATYGTASGVGVAAYLAALASGEAGAAALAIGGGAAAAGGFQKGGYTGGSDPTEIAGPAHEMEFVFGADAVKTLGVPFLQRLHDAALSGKIGTPGRTGGGRYDQGGDIWDQIYAPGGDWSAEPPFLSGNIAPYIVPSGGVTIWGGGPTVEIPTDPGGGPSITVMGSDGQLYVVPSGSVTAWGGNPTVEIPTDPGSGGYDAAAAAAAGLIAQMGGMGAAGGYGDPSFSWGYSGSDIGFWDHSPGAGQPGVQAGINPLDLSNTLMHMPLSAMITAGHGSGQGSWGGFATPFYHSGGAIDEMLIMAQLGEFMMQRSAVDHYGPEFMHDINNLRVDVGRHHEGGPIMRGLDPMRPISGPRGGLGGGKGSPDLHQAFFIDKQAALGWLKDREGIRTIIDVINGNASQLE